MIVNHSRLKQTFISVEYRVQGRDSETRKGGGGGGTL